MACRCLIPCVLVLSLVVGLSSPPDSAADNPADGAATVARKLWAVTDVVLEKHIAPPSRQEMLLTAVRSMTINKSVSAALGGRISDITTPEKLAPTIQEFWPQTAEGKPAGEKELTLTLTQALFQGVPGTPQVVPPNQFKVAEQISNNRYVGIGIQLSWNARENLTDIVVPFPGGPARKAGSQPGDLIVEVDGVSMANVPLGKVVDALRGEEGTPVVVVVRQPGSKETRTLKMTRGVVPFELLVGHQRVGEDGWNYRVDPQTPIAYVRAIRITSSAVHELRQIERQLQADGCRALILDLRFTFEGELQQGVRVADALLESGLICRLRDRQDQVKEYRADADCLFRNWPIAVLVGTATRGAGTELVATALKDNRRAVLLGEQTPGDRFVTSVVHLPHDIGVVRLPTAIVDRDKGPDLRQHPNGGALGVIPDHRVPLSNEESRGILHWQGVQEKPAGIAKEKAPADAALTRAMDLLRAKLK